MVPIAIGLIIRFDVPAILVIAICVGLAIAIAIVIFLPPSKKDQAVLVPSKITIFENGDILGESSRKCWEGRVKDVTRVIDTGTCYYLSLRRDGKIGPFACEKRLLKEGTFEEFEKLFEGKIVREEE